MTGRAVLFFAATAYTPAAILAGSWLGRRLDRWADHTVDAALANPEPITYTDHPDPRVAAGLELAKGNRDFAAWEAELGPYDWQREGL